MNFYFWTLYNYFFEKFISCKLHEQIESTDGVWMKGSDPEILWWKEWRLKRPRREWEEMLIQIYDQHQENLQNIPPIEHQLYLH